MRVRAPTVVTLGVALLLAGCQSADLASRAPAECLQLQRAFDLSDEIKTLNLLSDAFAGQCYTTVIAYGTSAQAQFRHKTFSLIKETFSVFLPDGRLTDYVLESYERGYLSLLLAASYIKTGRPEDAKVELRRLDHELFTPLYNYGEDPVNLVLSAVLWEHLGEPAEGRVDWVRLRDSPGLLQAGEEHIRTFAVRQIARLDRREPPPSGWRIAASGRFPKIGWDLQFLGSENGYFSLWPIGHFGEACASETGLRLTTRSWFHKVAIRHSHAYHPLLNVQSWVRLPVGMVYSLVPVAAGAGLAVGGCVVDAANKGNGVLCQVSIQGGIALMEQAPRVLKGTLEPDLRHWEHLPGAFTVSMASTDACDSGQGAMFL